MRWQLCRLQWLFFVALFAAFLTIGFWPTFGPAQFRYTGCDPDRAVWNLGWPLATCIVDAVAVQTFNVGPWAYVWDIGLLVSLTGCLAVFFAWNNREWSAARRASARVA